MGVMSGTSLDGIDVSVVKSDGIELEDLNVNYTIDYDFELINQIRKMIKLRTLNKEILKNLENRITISHIKALEKVSTKFNGKIDYISVHGQTIYHSHKQKKTVQLINARKLSNHFKIPVIYDFRGNDVKNGGHGAPLAPIYHQYLARKYRLEEPACFLNIGGIANISYINDNEIIGFDVGPGNVLINDVMFSHTGLEYDRDGLIASKGKKNQNLINFFLNQNYFKKIFPKSADRNEFHYLLENKEFCELNFFDQICTLTHFSVECVKLALKLMPIKPKSIIVCGGGQHNKALMKFLKQQLNCKVSLSKEINMNGDYVEANLIAFLGMRYLKKLPITFPNTTGISKASPGGKIVWPKK